MEEGIIVLRPTVYQTVKRLKERNSIQENRLREGRTFSLIHTEIRTRKVSYLHGREEVYEREKEIDWDPYR